MNSTTIAKVRELYDELHKLQDIMTANLRTVQDRYNEEEVDYNNGEAVVKVKQKVLWDEIRLLGASSEAGRILTGLYPELFEMEKKVIEKKKELTAYSQEKFGFNPDTMNLVNLIDLIDKIVEFRLNKQV